MLVMRTTERPAHSVGELVGAQHAVELHDPSLAMHPLGLDGVQPRALLRKQATDDPHPAATLLDAAVVPPEPSPHFFGGVPAGVVPDEQQGLLARRPSSSQHHERNCVVMELTGLPSTNLSHVSPSRGR